MKIRIRPAEIRNAHKLDSWEPDTWPSWLQECEDWVQGWKANNWLKLGDIVYMQGETMISGLNSVSAADIGDWEIIPDKGAGHDFRSIDPSCGTPSCHHWITCTLSTYCQRGKGRSIMAPSVIIRIHEESGRLTLRCMSYAGKTKPQGDFSKLGGASDQAHTQ